MFVQRQRLHSIDLALFGKFESTGRQEIFQTMGIVKLETLRKA